MPRFQLLIRELGKAPRVAPVTQTLVVGRSRRADVVIDDEEVSREQFRIGLQGALVFLEGLGKTNRTTVDGTTVDAGQRVTLNVGATIKVGRTALVLQAGEVTADAPARPGNVDATMVARGPSPPRPDQQSEQERTGGFAGPPGGATLPPGTAGQQTGANAEEPGNYGQTINVGFRPGGQGKPPAPRPAVPPPPSPPPDAPADGGGNTIQLPGGYRPGQAAPSGRSTPLPTESGMLPDATIQVPAGFRPGRGTNPPTPPPPTPPPTPPRPTPPPTDVTAPVGPSHSASRPPTPVDPAPRKPDRPKTVVVSPEQMKAELGSPTAPLSADGESRMHQAMPRLFVKGDTIRRRVRLMKGCTKVGRAETADVLLPNESVSELHAEIVFDGASWCLRDCGSTNGTLVDGEIVRGASRPIRRHSLLGFGNLRGLFLCNDAASAASDLRLEERALRLLVAAGRLSKDVAKQVAALARRDNTQSIAEILLGDTPIEPADWATAFTSVKNRPTLFDRLRALFTRKAKPGAR